MKKKFTLQALAYLLLCLPIFTISIDMYAQKHMNEPVINANTSRSDELDSEISSLTSRINFLKKLSDKANIRYLWSLGISVVIALGTGAWTVTCQYWAIRDSGKVSDAQRELLHLKDLKAAADSSAKDLEIGKANERAAQADERAGRANEAAGNANIEAAKANERASHVEAGNIQLRIDLESEQKKNAEAQKAAAEAQLTLRRNIEYAATPRRIIMGSRNNDTDLRAAKFKELEKYAGTYAIILFVNDEEAKLLAFDISHALTKSGWRADVVEAAAANIPLGYIQPGVKVLTHFEVKSPPGINMSMPPAPLAIVDLLSLDLGPPVGPVLGIRYDPDVTLNGNPMGLTRYGFKFPEGGVVITVGVKPVYEFLIFNDIPQSSTKK